MLLKAGTYRFNDVLSDPVISDSITYDIIFNSYNPQTSLNEDYVSFNFKGGTLGTYPFLELCYVTSNGQPIVIYRYYSGGITRNIWESELCQEIIIPDDTFVVDTFGIWFISNTNYNEVNPSLKIGETRLFNNTITGVNESETVIHDSFRFTLGNGVQQYGMQMANGRLYYDGTVDTFYQVAAGYILHDYATFIDDKYRTIILQELPTDPDIIALIENNSSVVENDSTRYLIKKTTLTGIANAIRSKSGKTDLIRAEDMASEIEALTVTNQ